MTTGSHATSSPQRAAELALAAGPAGQAGECAVIVDEQHTAHLRWAGNTLIANGATRSRRVTVIAITAGQDGRAAGVVSRAGETAGADAGTADLARAASRMASQLEPAPDGGPLPADGGPDDWDEPAAELEPAPLRGLAGELAQACATAAGQGRSLTGYAQAGVLTTYLATSTGLRRRHVQRCDLSDLTAQADGRTSWAGTAGPASLLAMDAELAGWLGQVRHQIDVPPGRYEVVLSRSCVADLMLALYQAADAQAAADGRTGFSRRGGGTRLGDRLSPQPLNLRSDPGEAGLTCAPFVVARGGGDDASVFDNGLALRPTSWITSGQLTALVAGRGLARLAGLPAAPAIGNLIMDCPAGYSEPDLIGGVRRGLLVTSLWYLRDVDPTTLTLTGLTRDGVYLIENGEITARVGDFRFNESLLRLLDQVVGVGRSEPTLPREWDGQITSVAMPPLRVEGFMMSTPTSRAGSAP